MSKIFESGTVTTTPWTDASGGMITVEEDAYLLNGSNTTISLSDGPWTVKIDGTVSGGNSLYVPMAGLQLGAFDGAKHSKVTIGSDGTLCDYGPFFTNALFLSQATDVANSGLIDANGNGIYVDTLTAADKYTIDNKASGVIRGGYAAIYDITNATVTLKNAGDISGWVYLHGPATITNSGEMAGKLTVDGVGMVTNHGGITGAVTLGAGDDKLTNSGSLGASVALGQGNNTFTNSGSVAQGTTFGDGDDKLTNTGEIGGNVALGEGKNVVINGGMLDIGITFGGGDDAMTNSGHIVGSVLMGSGNDKMTNSGVVEDDIYLGAGNDIFTGGTHRDSVIDEVGADVYKLGGGDDVYYAYLGTGDQNDMVDGGSGNDIYDAILLNPHAVMVNLDSTDTDIPFVGPLPAHTVVSAVGATETILNFERVTGSGFNDILIGGKGAETLRGINGDDSLMGHAGNDILDGGDDNDFIEGGLGADVLTGGAGNDQFVYDSVKDSGLTRLTRDRITDFQGDATTVHDLIDLSAIDANTKAVDDQPFVFQGANVAFTKVAGQLHSMQQGPDTIIEGDVNGDGRADFQITLTGTHSLDGDNFVL